MAKKNRMRRIRVLYALFIGVIAACIVLFVLNVVTSAEPLGVNQFKKSGKNYGLIITDLQSSSSRMAQPVEIAGLDSTMSGHVCISQFDVHLMSNNSSLVDSATSHWCIALQWVSVVAAAAMVVMFLMALISFYISARRGKMFPKKHIKWLVYAGVLMIVMSLGIDASTCVEQYMAMHLLSGTDWQPAAQFSLNLSRIFFGLTVIFTAELLYLGREMQEEQELTI